MLVLSLMSIHETYHAQALGADRERVGVPFGSINASALRNASGRLCLSLSLTARLLPYWTVTVPDMMARP